MTRSALYLLFCLFTGSLLHGQETDYILIKDIVIEGNKRTKSWVILKDCGYAIGDTIWTAVQTETLKDLETNVVNQQLFTQVRAQLVPLPGQEALVLITVSERWSIYPIPILELAEPNFNVWWRNRKESRTNFGLRLVDYNFRGRNEHLAAIVKVGYTREFALNYSTRYLSRQKDLGLQISASYAENSEVNTGTLQNERLFHEEDSPNTRLAYEALVGLTKRPSVYGQHLLQLGYHTVQVSDSLHVLHPDYLQTAKPELSYMSLSYGYRYSRTDRKGYPLEGKEFSLLVNNLGLGLLANSTDLIESLALVNVHYPIKGRWYAQHGLRGKTSFYNQLPYHLQRGLGYDENIVRSYEYSIMDAQHYVLNRNNLKFLAIKPRGLPMPASMPELFHQFEIGLYVNWIADIGYTWDNLYANENPLSNSILIGSGIGLDFVSNYDAVLRLEFSVNQDLEPGLFIHLGTSI